jgi:hypothetical protein
MTIWQRCSDASPTFGCSPCRRTGQDCADGDVRVWFQSAAQLSPSMSPPKRSTLQANIGAIRAKTWQAVNEAIVFEVRRRKVEDGRWMRTDATVVEFKHPPSAELGASLRWCARPHPHLATSQGGLRNDIVQSRPARERRSIAILHAGTMERRLPLYKDLLLSPRGQPRARRRARSSAKRSAPKRSVARRRLATIYRSSRKVIDQTERRVLRGEQRRDDPGA